MPFVPRAGISREPCSWTPFRLLRRGSVIVSCPATAADPVGITFNYRNCLGGLPLLYPDTAVPTCALTFKLDFVSSNTRKLHHSEHGYDPGHGGVNGPQGSRRAIPGYSCRRRLYIDQLNCMDSKP